jgi:hypothetical protein
LDSIISSNNGTGRPFLFFLHSSYWGFDTGNSDLEEKLEYYSANPPVYNLTDDVAEENDKTISKNLDDSRVLRIIQVSKTFNTLFKSSTNALQGVSFYAEIGKCLALLGFYLYLFKAIMVLVNQPFCRF